ncbi:MAG: endolytic transglycosylase MltG [Candidatus Doudnabacteria bacterium]|nr:endolytic transglycosylase MltG [Candidatus Doudnabacteria bacterium]
MKDYYKTTAVPNHTLRKIFALTVVLALLIVSALGIYGHSKLEEPLTYFSDPREFEVKKGESVSSVGQRLQEEHLIASVFSFRLYAFFRPESKVQAGKFLLDSNMTVKQILENLSYGRGLADEIKVTFVEGETAAEFAQKLEQAGLVSRDGFVAAVRGFSKSVDYDFFSGKPSSATLEGYLFPDTYFFSKNSSAEDVIGKMLENFGRKLDGKLRAEILRQGKTIFEIVTMAALVEGEVGRNFKPGTVLSKAEQERLSIERRLVAGVFYNRLRANRALESDATISYITGKKRASATLEETRLDHPYNTYRNRGLPPGPINNPSLDSILAAVRPAETDYFYFLSKPDGEAVFSKTLDEHNENKARYLD